MRILVTGAFGFIGRNLVCHLSRDPTHEVILFGRGGSDRELQDAVARCDFIFHLAGSNRPAVESEFTTVNANLTARIADLIRGGKSRPVLFASSIQADTDNPYGRSKLAAEQALIALHEETGNPIRIYRLPNVFGKWSRPNYNSVVATFCHNVAKSLPITISDPDRTLQMVYIDDVVRELMELLGNGVRGHLYGEVNPSYSITLGDLAQQVRSFNNSRRDLTTERVGSGLTRALYATYLSFLGPQDFSYEIPCHGDVRGTFVEILKTQDSGQFSFFTAGKGVTRGGHYHHTKSEKFLVVRGCARFRFTHVDTGERHELFTSQEKPSIVETVPGWAHDITNIGEAEMIVFLWANEQFDHNKPDTFAKALP